MSPIFLKIKVVKRLSYHTLIIVNKLFPGRNGRNVAVPVFDVMWNIRNSIGANPEKSGRP